MKKIAVILAGCGVYDGSEIHEATMTLLAIKEQGADYQCFAPNINQAHVINHLTGEAMDETRNVLVESARIARGNIKDLAEFKAADYDALVFPGGFGAAKNLSDLAFKGAEMEVLPVVEEAVLETVKAGKPVGALCISSVLMAKVLKGTRVTVGQDEGTIAVVESFGSAHEPTNNGEVIVDKAFKLVTTPCYMLDATIADVANGARNLVRAILQMV